MTTPNEPNKTRTIPLHIADQAVAACEAEIQKLKEENARIRKLFAETERLMLLDGEYEALKAGTYARLTAEVEKLETEVASIGSEYMAATRHYNSLHNDLNAENARLKEKSECQAECLEAFDKKLRQAEAEVERLRKAGDDMASSIQFNEEMEKDYDGPTIVHPSVERWNEAKEGKQS